MMDSVQPLLLHDLTPKIDPTSQDMLDYQTEIGKVTWDSWSVNYMLTYKKTSNSEMDENSSKQAEMYHMNQASDEQTQTNLSSGK